MDDNKIVHDETYKNKIKAIKPEQRSNSENKDVVEVPSRVGYHSLPVHVTVTPRPKRKHIITALKAKARCEKLLPTTLPKRKNSDLKSKLNHFRPIQPKPLQPDDSSVVPVPRHTFQLQPVMMNMPTSSSNRVFEPSTVLVKKNITPSDSNTINKSDTNNSNSNLNDSYSDNSSCRKNSSISCNEKYSRITRTIFRSHKGSTQLFFESMAHTILSLPIEVQARVKMQVCEIVTKAEIQYYDSQEKSKTEN